MENSNNSKKGYKVHLRSCPYHGIHFLGIPSGLGNCCFTNVLRTILMKRIHMSLKSTVIDGFIEWKQRQEMMLLLAFQFNGND